MTTLKFTKDNWPAPEKFQRLLREAMTESNPLDDLLELAKELRDYEQKYKMTSEEFSERFKRGELGDALDFIGWAGAYDLFLKRKARLETALMQAAIWQASMFEEMEAVTA